MTTTDYKTQINPVVLTWARETAGYDIDTVVNELNNRTVTADTIRSWEEGADKPFLTQFERLAKIYNRTEMLFYLPKPPLDDTLDRLGSLPTSIKEKLSPQIRFMHREARLKQIYLEELLPEAPPIADIALRGLATLTSDVELLARTVRERLAISIAEQKKWHDTSTALEQWRRAIESTGIWVFFEDFAQAEYDGFYLEDDQYPVIFIDCGLSPARQIFTLFHELGHVLLAKGGILLRSDCEQALAGEYLEIEQFCTDFATEFLVPAADFELSRLDYEAAADACTHQYKVGFEVLLLRAKDLNLGDSGSY